MPDTISRINAYLTFNGNCREAMTFYKDCLGGTLTMQTIGESPMSSKMSKHMKDCILHATLSHDGVILMGSDLVSENGLVKGNGVSLSLQCNNEEEITSYYTKLSLGGSQNHPLELNFWGAIFGDVTDKFGHHWLLYYNNKNFT